MPRDAAGFASPISTRRCASCRSSPSAKWAYEHGFAFFWRALRWPDAGFQRFCDKVEAMVNGLTALHYAVLKLARTEDAPLLAPILERLDALDAAEFAIKRQLGTAFDAWSTASPTPGTSARIRERLEA